MSHNSMFTLRRLCFIVEPDKAMDHGELIETTVSGVVRARSYSTLATEKILSDMLRTLIEVFTSIKWIRLKQLPIKLLI